MKKNNIIEYLYNYNIKNKDKITSDLEKKK